MTNFTPSSYLSGDILTSSSRENSIVSRPAYKLRYYIVEFETA